jgi:hypothetical protein
MPFNVEAAKAAGYTDDEISSYLASRRQAGIGEFEGPVKAPQDPQMYGAAGGPARSFLQGATLGWGDEIVAGASAAGLKLMGNPAPFSNLYEGIRGAERSRADQFRENNPKTDIGLKIGGGIASMAAGPLRSVAGPGGSYGALAAGGARVGAIAGAGNSEADTALGMGVDAAIGSGIGAAAGVAVPYGIQQGANATRWAADGVGRFGPLGSAWRDPVQATVSQTTGPALIAQQAALSGQTAAQPLSGEPARLVGRANDLGMWVPPGVRNNNPTLQRLDASLSSNPLTSAPFDAGRQQNREAITSMIAQKVGLPAGTKEIPPDKWGAAVDAVKEGLETVAEKIGTVQVGDDLAGSIRTAKSWEPALKIDEAAALTGTQAMSVRSQLTKLGSQLWRKGDQIKAEYVDDLVSQLDDAIERSGGEGVGKAYAAARAPWRWVKLFERPGVYDEGKGVVNPAALRNAVKQTTPGYVRGRDIEDGVGDPLLDALRFTQLSRDIVGDSGTATRLGFLGMIRNPIETAFTLGSRPVVNAYAAGGGPVTGSLLSPPGQPALVAQRGVLAAENASKERKRKR